MGAIPENDPGKGFLAYVGTKHIKAMHIDDMQYPWSTNKGALITDMIGNEFTVTAEFMQKHEPVIGGWLVMYEDGYLSFSPAEPFDKAYKLDHGEPDHPAPVPEMPRILDFADVIRGVKNGKRYTRTGWNGQGMFIEIQRPDSGSKMTLPYLFLVTTRVLDGVLVVAGVVPWLASQTDMLANDWAEVIVQQVPAAKPVPGPTTSPADDDDELVGYDDDIVEGGE